MKPDIGAEMILVATFLFLAVAGPTLAWAVFQLRWPRSELRRRRRAAEMSAASRSVADRWERYQARLMERARRRTRSGAIEAGRATRSRPFSPPSRHISADVITLPRVRKGPISDPAPALRAR